MAAPAGLPVDPPRRLPRSADDRATPRGSPRPRPRSRQLRGPDRAPGRRRRARSAAGSRRPGPHVAVAVQRRGDRPQRVTRLHDHAALPGEPELVPAAEQGSQPRTERHTGASASTTASRRARRVSRRRARRARTAAGRRAPGPATRRAGRHDGRRHRPGRRRRAGARRPTREGPPPGRMGTRGRIERRRPHVGHRDQARTPWRLDLLVELQHGLLHAPHDQSSLFVPGRRPCRPARTRVRFERLFDVYRTGPTKATGHVADFEHVFDRRPRTRYRPYDGHRRCASGGRGGDVAEKSGTSGGRKASRGTPRRTPARLPSARSLTGGPTATV